MGYDLGAGLRRLSDSADLPTAPVEPDDVVRSVRRRRAVRTGLTAGLGTAAVLALAVAVQAAPWATQDPPPAAPTTDPAPEPTSEPRTDDDPAPDTEEPTQDVPDTDEEEPPIPAGPASLVAVTTAGELVMIDPVTGDRVEVVTDGIAIDGDPLKTHVTVSADRTVAYVGHYGDGFGILRVSLPDGDAEPVFEGLRGYGPALSPDGRTLAFAGADPDAPQGAESFGLNIVDLATEEVRHVTWDEYNVARAIGQPSWSSDGTSLYLPVGWGEGLDVVRIDPETTTTLEGLASHRLGTTEEQSANAPQALADGRLLLAAHGWGFDPGPDTYRVLTVGPDGRADGEIAELAGMAVIDAAGTADGTRVAVLARPARSDADPDLFVWDGASVVHLGQQGLVAVGW
ncbi:hypothetical protein GXB85_06675 [Cellulomonas sp. APG4]|uniref:PD40 domain-containing protein n=1 Tax=Cellulomonas sp. APG4 TaxID=1538656 RepID=UPI0013795E5F|nr:PD40 domain-containing protein [Cellulomonas sp. APG4]NCT90627.1 hypothetical protein [Cellulomonas sp. APG4]